MCIWEKWKSLWEYKPSDGGFVAKWIEPNVKDSEKAIRIIRPLGSHAASYINIEKISFGELKSKKLRK